MSTLKRTTDLLDGIRNHFPLRVRHGDEYYYSMACWDFTRRSLDERVAKTHFMRKAPSGGSFAFLSGITAALRVINDLRFDNSEFREIMKIHGYSDDFIDYLTDRGRLKVQIFAGPEGTLLVPNEPMVVMAGSLIDIRIVEGIVTRETNYPTLSLTKWDRLRTAAGISPVMDFSLRRSQATDETSLAAILAGCETSNTRLTESFAILSRGTQGHEAQMSVGDVAEAFNSLLEHMPKRNSAIGLVDTVQCLEVDFPAWLEAVWKHREKVIENSDVWGWRNDSGDLVYLTLTQIEMFKKHQLYQIEWFRENYKVFLTNNLDEYLIKDIVDQISEQAREAGVEPNEILEHVVFAAGTKPGTCMDDPALSAVAKLSSVGEKAVIKLAFDANGLPGIKTSIPWNNRSAWILKNGKVVTTLIYPADRYKVEDGILVKEGKKLSNILAIHPDRRSVFMEISGYTAIQKQQLVFDSLFGEGFTDNWKRPSISGDIPQFIAEQKEFLDFSNLRFTNTHLLKVSLTPDLFDLRKEMIDKRLLMMKPRWK